MACVGLPVPVTSTYISLQRVSDKHISIHDSRDTKDGCTTRFWCCQDEQRKQKSRPSEREGVKHRERCVSRATNCLSKSWATWIRTIRSCVLQSCRWSVLSSGKSLDHTSEIQRHSSVFSNTAGVPLLVHQATGVPRVLSIIIYFV